MYRLDNFKQKESVGQAFYHSCLGKLIILAGIILILLILAIITKPSKEDDGVRDHRRHPGVHREQRQHQGRQDRRLHQSNIGHIFTKADTTQINKDLFEGLKKYNRIEIHDHTFFRTAYIHNNVHPEGVRVAWGAYGLVFPTVTYGDLLLYVGTMHGGYNKAIIKTTVPDQDMGTININEFHYKGDPDN